MMATPRVSVLGSINMDISVTVAQLPGPGATVLGSAARFAPGGKGGNQAVAAARLGAQVRMAGCVGDDDAGGRLTGTLGAEAVDVTAVRVVPGVASGLALITVGAEGENTITVAPGANESVSELEVAAAFGWPADVLVVSAEIPVPAIAAALARARAAHVACLLNLAPVPPGAASLLSSPVGGADWLVVNESEASAVLGLPVAGLAGARAAAIALTDLAVHAVVTAGAEGAAFAGPDGHDAVPGFPVHAVDSVGAGDTFAGALAVALGLGVPAAAAVRAACAAAAVATTVRGTQDAMPRPGDVQTITGVTWPPVAS